MVNRVVGILAWAAVAFIVYATLVPLEMRPTIRWIGPNAERFAAYAAGAGLMTLAYPRHWIRVGVFAIALAGGLELLQLAAPHRHARLADALLKMAGALAGIAVAQVWNRLQMRSGDLPAGN
jgi:VanZ family protein